MAKLEPAVLAQLELLVKEYANEVEKSDLKLTTKWTYVRHAQSFVRWLADDFEPGSQVKP